MDDEKRKALDRVLREAGEWPIVGEYRKCEHGYHHPGWAHSCDGCYCDDLRDEARGWTPQTYQPPRD